MSWKKGIKELAINWNKKTPCTNAQGVNSQIIDLFTGTKNSWFSEM